MHLRLALLACLLAAPALAQQPQRAQAPARLQWFELPIISPSATQAAARNGGRVEIDPDGCEKQLTREGLDGTAAPLGGYVCRPRQRAFDDLITDFRRQYNAARNPIVQADLRAARRQALCRDFTSGALQNWEGTLRGMERKPNGNVALTIVTRAGGIELQSSFADDTALSRETQARPGTPIFENLRALRDGQRVHFSATLIRGREDCFLGTRETELQMMMYPRFFARFHEVWPVE